MSCTCQYCGKQYKVDLVIPDNIWNKIRPEGRPGDAGMLCGSCIMDRVEKISDYDYWCLSKETDVNIKLLISLLPNWVKTVHKGLDPTMYGTGDYEGDLNIKNQIDIIKERYKKGKNE